MPQFFGPSKFQPAADSPALAQVTVAVDALMAAMNWPWPVIAMDTPTVVASGMTPPSLITR